MGDQVAEISYGVMLKEDDYKKLQSVLYEEKESKPYKCWTLNDKGKSVKITTTDKYLGEKDEKFLLTLEQPYETEDYLLVVRESQQCSFNGTNILKDFNSFNYSEWDKKLNQFILEHKITPETKIGWMLTAHYG
jgi:hypothetical protein